jgi:predicted ATPase
MPALTQRETLVERLAAAQRAGGRLVLIGGEAGAGKTVLVDAFINTLQRRVLVGACEHLATPAPLGPLLDVAEQVGGALGRDVLAATHPRQVAHCLLEDLRRPAVLVLEDLRWADDATRDVLRSSGAASAKRHRS